MKKIVIILVFIVFCLPLPTVLAKDKNPYKLSIPKLPSGKWWNKPKLSEKLNLTDDEKATLDKVYRQNQMQIASLEGYLDKEKPALEDMFKSDSFNASDFMDRLKKFYEVRSKLEIERFRFAVEVRELLGKERFYQLKNDIKSDFPRYRKKIKRGAF